VTTTIRISEETRDRLAVLAGSTGQPMTRVLDQAVDALERRLFFEQLNRRFGELRRDPPAWAEVEAERRLEGMAGEDASP